MYDVEKLVSIVCDYLDAEADYMKYSFFYFMVSKFAFLSVIKIESQNNGGMTHDNEN